MLLNRTIVTGVMLLTLGCRSSIPASPERSKALAGLTHYASISKVSRAVLPPDNPWISDWFQPETLTTLTVSYGVTTTGTTLSRPEPSAQLPLSDKLHQDTHGDGQAVSAKKPIKQLLLPLGTGDLGQTQLSGTFRFTVTVEPNDGPAIVILDASLELSANEVNRLGWRELTYSLKAFNHKQCRLTCSWEQLSGDSGRGVFSVPRLRNPSQKEQPQGLILISFDTLRADHLGAYGYPRPCSPTLDSLSRAGLLVTEARSVSAWTLPAHVSLLTGTGPTKHQVNHAEAASYNPDLQSLPQQLAANGWLTAAFTGGAYVSAKWGLERGFDVFDFSSTSARDSFARAEQWLRANDSAPFFLFLHNYDAHLPYNIHNPRPVFTEPGQDNGGISHAHSDLPVATIIDLYDDAIRNADKELGNFLKVLANRGLLETTTIVIVSDHGEEFTDHGRFLHNLTLYEEIIRIPVLIVGPRVLPGLVNRPFTITDLYPTICKLMGITCSASGTVLSEAPLNQVFQSQVAETRTHNYTLSITDTIDKIILSDEFGIRRFDLAADPAERNPKQLTALSEVPWRALLTEMSKAAAGRLQVWVLNAQQSVTVAFEGCAQLTSMQSIMATAPLLGIDSTQNSTVSFNPVHASPLCGLILDHCSHQPVYLIVDGKVIPDSQIFGGFGSRSWATPSQDQLPAKESSHLRASWLRSVPNPGPGEAYALLLVPPESQVQVEPNPVDEVLREQLRNLGYLE